MSKTKKIIYFIISATLCICLFAVSVSAQSYEFKDTTILTEDTLLRVSNGKDYSKKYTPSTYIDHNENSGNENDLHGENYAMVQYSIRFYT